MTVFTKIQKQQHILKFEIPRGKYTYENQKKS